MLLAARDQRLPLVLGVLAAFVLVFAVCALSSLRRHRWTIDAVAVLIEEQPFGRRRMRRVQFGPAGRVAPPVTDGLGSGAGRRGWSC